MCSMRKSICLTLTAVTLCQQINSYAQDAPKGTFIVAVNPIHITDDNIGFAASYEYFLGKQKTISLYLPFMCSLPSNRGNNPYENDEEYYYFTPPYNYPSPYDLHSSYLVNKGMAYFYPGIKVYVSNSKKKTSYAIGGSLVVGFGQANQLTRNYVIDTLNSG